ncbi:MAG: PhzF family phenazine biosynthesis protein [bacterium]
MNNLFVIDAFASEPFAGNQAAVLLLDSFPEDAWMLSFAAEMRHSETAYLVRKSKSEYDLRWFTPAVEVDLCGHATLASAHVLFNEGFEPEAQQLSFHTRSGILIARREGDDVALDFPASPPIPLEEDPDPDTAAAFGFCRAYAGASTSDFLLLIAPDDETVRALKPDFNLVRKYPQHAVIVAAKSDDPEFDFISRMFAPRLGIDEDPVTGSAHCVLTPWFAERLGKTELRAFQASSRGGHLLVRAKGERVEIVGSSRTNLAGELRLTP